MENQVSVFLIFSYEENQVDPFYFSSESQGAAANTSEAIFSAFEFTTMAETLVASGESSAFGRTERWDTCTTKPPIFSLKKVC